MHINNLLYFTFQTKYTPNSSNNKNIFPKYRWDIIIDNEANVISMSHSSGKMHIIGNNTGKNTNFPIFQIHNSKLHTLINRAKLKGTLSAHPNPETLEIYKQLVEYFAQTRTKFTITVKYIVGTDFQKNVWNTINTIQYGTTKSYSQIAETIYHPRAIRTVGTAVANNPIAIIIPCHRVLPKKSTLQSHSLTALEKINVGQYQGGSQLKTDLLRLEYGINA